MADNRGGEGAASGADQRPSIALTIGIALVLALTVAAAVAARRLPYLDLAMVSVGGRPITMAAGPDESLWN